MMTCLGVNVSIYQKNSGHPLPGCTARAHYLTTTSQAACGSEIFARQHRDPVYYPC